MTIFKQQTGTSCIEFIIQARLNAACEELRNSVKPVLEIATDVGFNNLSNFNRQFKHYYDQTPSQYRKTHSNNKKTKRVSQMVNSFLSANFLVFLFAFVFTTKSKESEQHTKSEETCV